MGVRATLWITVLIGKRKGSSDHVWWGQYCRAHLSPTVQPGHTGTEQDIIYTPVIQTSSHPSSSITPILRPKVYFTRYGKRCVCERVCVGCGEGLGVMVGPVQALSPRNLGHGDHTRQLVR